MVPLNLEKTSATSSGSLASTQALRCMMRLKRRARSGTKSNVHSRLVTCNMTTRANTRDWIEDIKREQHSWVLCMIARHQKHLSWLARLRTSWDKWDQSNCFASLQHACSLGLRRRALPVTPKKSSEICCGTKRPFGGPKLPSETYIILN